MTFPVIGGQVTTEVGWCARVVCALPSGGLLVIDQWESAQPPGASNLLIPSEWLVDTEEPAVVRARFGDVETDLVIYHGRLATREDKTWSRHYFQTEKATSLQLEPARDSGGNQRLVFGIGVVDSSEVASARVQAETLDLRGRTSMSARP
ncbi:hypothetical protein B1R94_04925 [Mycolicibacterium litorale]|nr:hypothetical protein B1R94_04925 [Mycolicibacterium litorale]